MNVLQETTMTPRSSLAGRLTGREREVMTLACAGLTSKEIAFELGITTSTTNVLIARVRLKLGFLSRQALLEALGPELVPGYGR